MTNRTFMTALLLIALGFPARADEPKGDPSPFLPCLQLCQLLGHPELLTPERDLLLKAKVGEWLKSDNQGHTVFEPQPGMFERGTFPPRSNGISAGVVPIMLRQEEPKSRRRLLPSIQIHADILMTQLDMIAADHQSATTKLASWIAKNYSENRDIDVVFLGTTDGDRSIIAATWGRIAASYHDLERVKFHCAGNAATAFNPRALKALREMGVEIDKTLEKRPSESKSVENWAYSFKWADGQVVREYAKKYDDPTLPKSRFAAVLVCGELDENCVAAKSADIKLSVPYLNPALYDHSFAESAKYAERRDDIGRFMLSSLMQAKAMVRRKVVVAPKADAAKEANPFDALLKELDSRPGLKGGELTQPRLGPSNGGIPVPKDGGKPPKNRSPAGRGVEVFDARQ